MTSQPASGPRREHFIPIRKAELVAGLTDSLDKPHATAFSAFCKLLESTYHYQFHQKLEKLKDTYASFDPDRDTRSKGELVESRSVLCSTFFANVQQLLTKANFERLDREHLEQALEAASDWGIELQVDFSIFDRLEVYARGDVLSRRTRRRWQNFYRREEVDVPLYQRLVVMFRLHRAAPQALQADPDCIYLKLFKNIPKMDMEMLLPGTRVKMSRLDKGKIILPTLSGIVITLLKLAKSVALLATATVSGLLGFLVLIGGTIGYGVKSFFGYLRTKDKYQLNLTRSLYYQNLDNNAGVLHRILDEAEEQEVREAAVAYYLLWQTAPPAGWTETELDRVAEAYFRDVWSLELDFEADDALAKLIALKLVTPVERETIRQVSPDGAANEPDTSTRYRAVPIATALRILNQTWDGFFTPPVTSSVRRAA